MADIFGGNSRGAQRYVGFFLGCAVRTLIGWTGEVRPHDWRALVVGFSFVFGQASVITSSPRTQPRK